MSWLRKPDKPLLSEANWLGESRAVVAIGKHAYAFGIDWAPAPDRKLLKMRLDEGTKEGYTHYVLGADKTLLGMAIASGKGPIYSAALHLAHVAPHPGIVYFCFKLPAGQYAVTALNQGSPIAGFDRTCTEEDVASLLEELRSLYPDTTVRVVSNIPDLKPEPLDNLQQLFASPHKAAQLSDVSPVRARIALAIIGGIVAIVLAGGGVMAYLYYAEQERQAELKRQQEADPNYQYELSVDQAVSQAGTPGNTLLEAWLATSNAIPIDVKGWTLDNTVCSNSGCIATWKRQFGNSDDFFSGNPEASQLVHQETQSGDNPAAIQISVTYPIQIPPEAPKLSRPMLPVIQDVQRRFASQLQDISLLPNSSTKLSQPVVFPETPSPSAIQKPVVRSSWQIGHELWALPDISLDNHIVPEKLEVKWPSEQSSKSSFTLSGYFYAKGKQF